MKIGEVDQFSDSCNMNLINDLLKTKTFFIKTCSISYYRGHLKSSRLLETGTETETETNEVKCGEGEAGGGEKQNKKEKRTDKERTRIRKRLRS